MRGAQLLFVVVLASCGSNASKPVPRALNQTSSSAKPEQIAGAVPVAPFVAETLASAPERKTVVYVGAKWCEPCRRFHDALQAGELDAQLSGVRFIEYDLDLARDALAADGYTARLIPLFALPAADGRCSGRSEQGSIKGDGAVQNIMPRLQALLR